MNGMTGARRLARPVRLVLGHREAPLNGAWWPYTGSVAGELPELIETLHRPLGEVLDIRVNWSATQGAPDLDSILGGGGVHKVAPRRRHRLMVVIGRSGTAKLLVVPHMTTPALGAMVMRFAAGRLNLGFGQDSQWCEAAQTVIRDAQMQSTQWTGDMPDLLAKQPSGR